MMRPVSSLWTLPTEIHELDASRLDGAAHAGKLHVYRVEALLRADRERGQPKLHLAHAVVELADAVVELGDAVGETADTVVELADAVVEVAEAVGERRLRCTWRWSGRRHPDGLSELRQ